ncbi:MAG: thioredoxin family protein [Anaerolineae bacterium]|jgi:small redox-active disulfide protein 2|nr:thioredoxin family protein [Anaerolineae bacterium]
MVIKILGRGCPKCQRLEELTREVTAELGVEAVFEHVKEMDEIMAYDIANTPGLVIDEVVKSSGRIPQKEEIAAWIKEAR